MIKFTENEFSDSDSSLDLESNRISELSSDIVRAHALRSTKDKSIDCDIVYGKNLSTFNLNVPSEESEDGSENESEVIIQSCSGYIQYNICSEYIASSSKSTNTICDIKSPVKNIPLLHSNLSTFPIELDSEDSDWEPEFESIEKHSDVCKMYAKDKSIAVDSKIVSSDTLNVASKFQNVAKLASEVSSFFYAVDGSSDEESSNSSDDSDCDEGNNSSFDEKSCNSSDDSDCDEGCNSVFFDESEFEFLGLSNAIESKTTCCDALNVTCKSQDVAVLASKEVSSFFYAVDSSSSDEESSNSSSDSDWDESCNSEFFDDESEFQFSGLCVKNFTTSQTNSSHFTIDSVCQVSDITKLDSLLHRVNSEWNEATKDLNGKSKSSKVSFAPDEELVKEYPVEIYERKGEWEIYALERIRFKRRIDEMAKIISPILSKVHRANVFLNLYSNQ
ncbi:PP1c_bdg domain-containing protein [Trichonephila inaurata madagascariensis]|uniref:PP1c_bdg domain-containing protein n=1 Tax=Trichonephila inaurata madagascariensis TaxID=2747483 RepID=A0A8X6KBT8_9ARAC|nr:PP1c_bdg domain-containing protein [Trichonephila inaurata madagascariensis]